MPKSQKTASNVDKWLENETPHKRTALENASRHFNGNDSLTVNTLEAIYGQESSFGKNRRKRGIAGAAGDFHLERSTAKRMGLTVTSKNDQRFDIDDASAAAAKYLKTLDIAFSKNTILSKTLKTIPISDPAERIKFTIAAYNAGEGRIAKAQKKAQEAGKAPTKWNEVKSYLKISGATPAKAREINGYVDKVARYEHEFSIKSKADKSAKSAPPKKVKDLPEGGHWITKDGVHIFIEEKGNAL